MDRDDLKQYLLEHLDLEVVNRSNDPEDGVMCIVLLVDCEEAARVDLPS